MTEEELANLPKEVMVSCVPEEIVYVYNKLPENLKQDPDIIKYLYCTEHYNEADSDNDVADGPPPRRVFCCYCNINEVSMGSANAIEVSNQTEKSTTNCSIL